MSEVKEDNEVKFKTAVAESMDAPLAGIVENIKEATALLYCFQKCIFCRIENGEMTTMRDGGAGEEELEFTDFSSVFEARIFCPDWELRWLKDGQNAKLSLLFEKEGLSDEFKDMGLQISEQDTRVLDNQYMLWGATTLDGFKGEIWTELVSPRVGHLMVPCAVNGNDKHIILETKEYFRAEEKYGNYVFEAERLCGLKEIGG